MYSLGVAFKSFDNRILYQYSQTLQSNPWALIWQDYQSIIHQLLSYDSGIPINEKSFPHQSMINKTELLINKLERYMEYRYQDVKLQFVIDDTQQTPIANSKQKLQSDTPINGFEIPNDDSEMKDNGVQEELSFWKYIVSKNTKSAYIAYIQKYPKGNFVKDANKKIVEFTKLEDEQEGELWQQACKINTIYAYEVYLNKSIKQKFAIEAKRRIDTLKKDNLKKQKSLLGKHKDSGEESNHQILSDTPSERYIFFIYIVGIVIAGFFASLWSNYGLSSLVLTTGTSFFEDLKNFGFWRFFYLLLIKPLFMFCGLSIGLECGLVSFEMAENKHWDVASFLGAVAAIIAMMIVFSVFKNLSYWGAFFIVFILLCLLNIITLPFALKGKIDYAIISHIVIWGVMCYMGYQYIANNPKISKPLSNYVIDNQSGVIIDNDNKLVWSMCSLGQEWNHNRCIYQPIKFSIKNREQAMNKLNENNQDKNYWRLPTIEELNTLRKRECIVGESSEEKIPTNLWYRPNVEVVSNCYGRNNTEWLNI